MGLGDERQDGAESGSAGDTENVGIGERIAKQRLKAGARNGERRANDDGEKDAGEADVNDDHAVIAGESAGLAQKDVDEIDAETVKGDLNRAELQGGNHDGEENDGENAAAQEKTPESQHAHASASMTAGAAAAKQDEGMVEEVESGGAALGF